MKPHFIFHPFTDQKYAENYITQLDLDNNKTFGKRTAKSVFMLNATYAGVL